MKREENQTVEYKESWHERYLEWVCGYANAKGGTLYIEKFGEEPGADSDAQASLDSAVAFAKAEFGTEATVERLEEKIPNTRAPYHVTVLVRVDASKRVAELAA